MDCSARGNLSELGNMEVPAAESSVGGSKMRMGSYYNGGIISFDRQFPLTLVEIVGGVT